VYAVARNGSFALTPVTMPTVTDQVIDVSGAQILGDATISFVTRDTAHTTYVVIGCVLHPAGAVCGPGATIDTHFQPAASATVVAPTGMGPMPILVGTGTGGSVVVARPLASQGSHTSGGMLTDRDDARIAASDLGVALVGRDPTVSSTSDRPWLAVTLDAMTLIPQVQDLEPASAGTVLWRGGGDYVFWHALRSGAATFDLRNRPMSCIPDCTTMPGDLSVGQTGIPLVMDGSFDRERSHVGFLALGMGVGGETGTDVRLYAVHDNALVPMTEDAGYITLGTGRRHVPAGVLSSMAMTAVFGTMVTDVVEVTYGDVGGTRGAFLSAVRYCHSP
jgi:hypothetical protein